MSAEPQRRPEIWRELGRIGGLVAAASGEGEREREGEEDVLELHGIWVRPGLAEGRVRGAGSAGRFG